MKMIMLYIFLIIGILLIGTLTVISKNEPLLEKGFTEIRTKIFQGYAFYDPEIILKEEKIDINYKNKNMTIEFKEGETIIGEATLKSHKTYDEIRKVISGENRTVIWYEFSEFKDVQLEALKGVEFIDMREEIANKSYIKEFEKYPELMNESKIIIFNPNYLLPIEKNYSFVYLENGEWLDYNSLDIPKENMTIGVQIDLGWGEYLDVVLEIFSNKLDKHAMVLGTNYGFVETAPTSDPDADSSTTQDTRATSMIVTSPATAVKVTEIGWYTDQATATADFDVGIYTDAGNGEPEVRLHVSANNAKGTSAGWIVVSGLDWEISGSTVYWLAVQLDDTAFNTIDYDFNEGDGFARLNSQTSLPANWGTSGSKDADARMAAYAVWEAEVAVTCDCPSGEDWLINDGSVCRPASDCDIGAYSLKITDGGLLIDSGINVYARGGCYVQDGERLFVEDGGGLYCEG